MLNWVIPYLVAYNASIPSGWDASEPIDWEYGPEHVFNAAVSLVFINHEYDFTTELYYHIKFVCKPMSSKVIRCHIIRARMEMIGHSIADEDFGLDQIVFEIEYNAEGISRVWFLNNDRMYFQNMIRAIIGTMNLGINIASVTVGSYVAIEKSVIGTCNTSFIIKNEILADADKLNERQVKGFEFVVPSLGPPAENETIVVQKDRHLKECMKETPSLFGSVLAVDEVAATKSKLSIVTSSSQFNFGRRSFSALTQNSGIIEYFFENGLPSKEIFHVSEIIRIKLEAIRPARFDRGTAQHSMNLGAGFEPGFPWPDRT